MTRHGLLESGRWTAVTSTLLLVVLALPAAAQSDNSKAAPSAGKTAEVYTTWPFDAKEAVKRQDETAKFRQFDALARSTQLRMASKGDRATTYQ
jgi:hypothetical protein